MKWGPRTFVVKMVGDSMAPRLRDGLYLSVDPDAPLAVGGIVALRDPETGAWTAREVAEEGGRRVLRALAPESAEFALEADGGVTVEGVVVFAGCRV